MCFYPMCDLLCKQVTIACLTLLTTVTRLLFYHSMSGHRVLASPPASFYSAKKFAVTALTEGQRKELRDQKSNIKITVSLTVCLTVM